MRDSDKFKTMGMAGRIVRGLAIFVPAALYAMFVFGAGPSYGLAWIKALAGVLLVYLVAAILLRSLRVGAGAYFVVGLIVASLSGMSGAHWVHMAFIPYVFVGATVFGGTGALLCALAVPVLEVRHLMLGLSAEDATVIGLSAFSGAVAYAIAIRAGSPLDSRKRQGRGMGRPVSRTAGDAMGRRMEQFVQDSSDQEAAPPVDLAGLEQEQDDALRELLRVAAFATRAAAVSLFVRSGDGLRLRCSSVAQSGRTDSLISPVPTWFVNDVHRLMHTIVTGNLGAETTQGFDNLAVPLRTGTPDVGAALKQSFAPSASVKDAVSIVATPVLAGTMVVGVLAVSSPVSSAFRGPAVTVMELLASQVARTLADKRVLAENERDMENLRLVYQESARLVSSIDLKEIISILADVMGKLSGIDVHVYIRTPSGVALACQSGPMPSKPGPVEMDGTLAGMAMSEGEARYISSLKGYTKPVIPEQGAREFASAMLLPLVCADEAMGLVALTSHQTDPLRPLDIERLKLVERQAAISLKNSLFHTEMKVRAATDALTGLNNRRSFMEKLEAENTRFSRTAMGYTVAMIDIDHFKRVNDTYGHQAGDEVIRRIAAIMMRTFRNTDILGRYGGEEFAAILINTGESGAREIAERVRSAAEAEVVRTEGWRIEVTLSIGLAEVRDGDKAEALLGRADEALYKAKEGGRNQVVFWTG